MKTYRVSRLYRLSRTGAKVILTGAAGFLYVMAVTHPTPLAVRLLLLAAIALFGWLLERRHGPLVVLALFLIGGVGGLAASAALNPDSVQLGAVGGALALACAWATPDLLTLRSGGEVEGDVIGAAAIAVAVALMPLAVTEASWVSDAVGVIAGFAIGLPLALLGDR